MSPLSNVETRGGEHNPPCVGSAPDAIPEVQDTEKGVSVDYIPDRSKKWFVFRASYGRVDRAADYLIGDGTYAYVAKRYALKYIGGRRQKVLEPLIPNLLFAYTSEEKAEEYVKKTAELSFLSYYYNHFEQTSDLRNPPLTVPEREMLNFIRATASRNEHLMFVKPSQCHYKSGETVRVVDGLFKGVEGKVARVAGQQRVVITLSRLGLVSTAYIPTAFIEKA